MMFRIILLTFLFTTNLAFANKLIEVNPSEVEIIEVGKRTFSCTKINQKIIFGTSAGENLIKPFSVILRKSKKQFKKATAKNAAKRERRFLKLRSINKKAKKKCRQALNGGGDSNPPADENNFDSNGEVTATGKALFQIPTNLSANVSTGLTIFQENCVGCHMEVRNRTFTQYRELIKQLPMEYYEEDIPNQELAHLVAYLNRFRLR